MMHLRVTSDEGRRWLILPDVEIELELPESQTREVTFLADQCGDYRCGSREWDGTGLQVMTGRLRVQ